MATEKHPYADLPKDSLGNVITPAVRSENPKQEEEEEEEVVEETPTTETPATPETPTGSAAV